MIRLKFKCPQCQREISVKAPSKDALIGLTFSCPHCHVNTPFSSILGASSQKNAALHTHIAGGQAVPQGGAPQKTQVARIAPLAIVLIDSGRRIPVGQGAHILGRDSADSPATVRLAPDPYMSRQHARLDISSQGKRLTCRIQSLKSANTMIVNGSEVAVGNSVSLSPGDIVTLGMTKFRIEINK